MNINKISENLKPDRIFSLELNVITFLSPIIIMIICFSGKGYDIKSIITTALTFSFTAYILKLSRTYEQVNTDLVSFMNLLLAPRKNEVKTYFIVILSLLFVLSLILISALAIYCGFNLDETNSLPKLIIGGYWVSLAFVGIGYLAILIIFDFIIKCTLKITLKVEKE